MSDNLQEIDSFKNEQKKSEKELIKQILRGDNNAFKKLINDNKRLVASIVYKILRNAEDREDISQDIFIKVYTNLRTFKFESKLSTWIAKISYTTCLNHLKKKKVDLFDDMNSEGNEWNTPITEKIQDGNSSIPDDVFRDSERKNILSEEVEALPVLWKTILTLYHSEDMKYDEICKITGLPIGTVKSYLFRARKSLKEKLESKFAKEDIL